LVRGAVYTQLRLIVSCRHAADPSLTDKDGKQDAEEDDDEKDELHGQEATALRRQCQGRAERRRGGEAMRELAWGQVRNRGPR
jgi:hypothetical protein